MVFNVRSFYISDFKPIMHSKPKTSSCYYISQDCLVHLGDLGSFYHTAISILMHPIAPYCTVMYYNALYCVLSYCIALYCIALHSFAWHSLVFYCLTPYCIAFLCLSRFAFHRIQLYCGLNFLSFFLITSYISSYHTSLPTVYLSNISFPARYRNDISQAESYYKLASAIVAVNGKFIH